ncbi:MAG: ABC transporter permease, partial [Caldilineaceae bacterium]|nr:ABC transporter permease [Caldilineaceae bacterium]
MVRYILARLAGLLFVLLLLSMITFALMHGVPGGPWAYGQHLMSDEQIAALEARYGLDKPVWQQYLIWLQGVVRLDFGHSFQRPDETVLQLIGRTWPVTFH